ncbi:hypothetical protein WG66_005145, partial [Moniliophthora roreri]
KTSWKIVACYLLCHRIIRIDIPWPGRNTAVCNSHCVRVSGGLSAVLYSQQRSCVPKAQVNRVSGTSLVQGDRLSLELRDNLTV